MAECEKLLQIDSGFFCAGVEIGVTAAPIIWYMKDWSEEKIKAFCKRKGWSCVEIDLDKWMLDFDDTLECMPKRYLPGLME